MTNKIRSMLWGGRWRKVATCIVGAFVALMVISAILDPLINQDQATSPPAAEGAEPVTPEPTDTPEATPTSEPEGWTAEQREQFITTFKEGEARLIAEFSPEVRELGKRTTDEALACVVEAVAAAYPASADKIIAEMWIDTKPDDTPLVDDQLSDAILFADGVGECW